MLKFTRKKGPVRSKKVTYDGVTFASGLEKYMHCALKDAGIENEYEGKTFQLIESFQFENSCFERQANGKGELIDRGNKKVLGIKYTPDFIGSDFIIETKGRANESFPLRWKIFKAYIKNNIPGVTLYKPQNQKECDMVVELILKNTENKKNGK